MEYDYESFKSDSFVEVEKGIWKNSEDGTFHFVDETENFQGPYNSLGDAQRALKLYVEHIL